MDYVHMSTYNLIGEKIPCVPIIHFYILIRFNIRRHFCASLYVRILDSIQPVKYTRKHHTNNPYHKLHHYITTLSILHNQLTQTPTIIHTKKFSVLDCHLHHKILYETKLSYSTLLYPHTLHTSSYTYK